MRRLKINSLHNLYLLILSVFLALLQFRFVREIRSLTFFNFVNYFGTLLFSLVIYHYQYNSKKVDYYYRLPISKMQLFLHHYLKGILILLSGQLLGYIILMMFGQPVYLIFYNALISVLMFTIASAIVYFGQTILDILLISVVYPGCIMALVFAIDSIDRYIDGFALISDFTMWEYLLFSPIYHFGVSDSYLINRFIEIIGINFLIYGFLLVLIVKGSKPEYIGKHTSFPKIYQVFKIIATFELLLLLSMSSLSGFNLPITSFDYFLEHYLSKLLIPMLITYMVYLLGTFIQKKSIKYFLRYTLQYLMIATIFILGMSGFFYGKPLIENQPIPQIQSIAVKENQVPYIMNKQNKKLVEFTDSKYIAIVEKAIQEGYIRHLYISETVQGIQYNINGENMRRERFVKWESLDGIDYRFMYRDMLSLIKEGFHYYDDGYEHIVDQMTMDKIIEQLNHASETNEVHPYIFLLY